MNRLFSERMNRSLTDSQQVLEENLNISEQQVEKALMKIPEASMVEFINRMKAVYDLIQNLELDLLFVPHRGAAPLQWILETYQQFDTAGKKLPEMVWLPLGTSYDIQSLKPHGIRIEVTNLGAELHQDALKKSVIKNVVDTLLELHLPMRRVAVIDEVQSGSTFTQAVILLNEVFNDLNCESSISAIAILDSNTLHEKNRVPQYKRMMAGVPRGITLAQLKQFAKKTDSQFESFATKRFSPQNKIETHQITLPLDTVDLVALLPIILSQEPDDRVRITEGSERFSRTELMEPVSNPVGENYLKTIASEIITFGFSQLHRNIISQARS